MKMRIQLALALLLYLQGSCICSELRRRQNHVTAKNLTTISPKKEIAQPEITTNSDSASSVDLPPTSTIFAATEEEISTTSIPARSNKPERVSSLRRNRTQEVTSPSPKSSTFGVSSTEEVATTPTATEAEITTTTEDGDEAATTDPAPMSTWEYFTTIEETTTEAEIATTFATLPGDNQTENITGDGVHENRPPHCSNECAVLRRSNDVRYSPLLAKLIHRFSKPGAFEKGKSAFEEEADLDVTLCPPGDTGLLCRQAEARKGAEECYGGNCEECRTCDETAVTKWPHCCRDSFRCCSQLALACQQCDKPALQVFCSKHFKRCS